MAQTSGELNPNEIYLGTTFFPIRGRVAPSLISTMPGKITIGEHSLADEQIASSWIINDQRGGILVEEMDETVHTDRCWWSTDNLGFRGHNTLPPLAATATSATAPAAPTIANADMELESDWTGGNRSGTEYHANGGKIYSWKTNKGSAGNDDAYQDMSTYHPGLEYTFTCWVKVPHVATSLGHAHIILDDGVTETESDPIAESSSWAEITVVKTLAQTADKCRLILRTTYASGDGTSIIGYFDDASISITAITGGTSPCFCHFNGVLYASYGATLADLNTGGTGFDFLREMPATITDIFHDGTNMYIFLGDATHYYIMDTSQAFTATTNAAGLDATYGIYWDVKVMKIDSAGEIQLLTNPATATPTETTKGSLPIADNSIETLFTYRDADGDDIIYAGTHEGLWALVYASAKWIATELKTPNHPTVGKGAVVWRDAAYIAAGLDVHRYIAASTATITSMGLDRDDGLPQLRSGEVVKFIEGYNEFFALVDSTYEGSTSRSTVMAWDGKGWQCWWEATADNKTMYSGIVSTDTAYRLWFSTTDGVYLIPIQRTSRNPKKISGYTYAAAGVHMSPWFDGGWIGNKNALSITVFCKDTTANETIQVSYRIDHATVNLGAVATEWTSLGTVVAAGDGIETEYTFGTSAVGVNFKAIQFRFDLVRGSTTTLSPDLLYAKFKYEKLLDTKWGWTATIDCTEEYGHNSPSELVAALEAVIATGTLSEFTFTNESGTTNEYVRVANCRGMTRTGNDWRSVYEVSLVAP